MSYVTHFDAIKRLVEVSSIRGKAKVTLSYDDFISIIRLMIADVEVNEAWYLGQYPDVAEAVALWLIRSKPFGELPLLVGGESIGATISLLTLLRLRDLHGLTGNFRSMNLIAGNYDFSMTPSQRLAPESYFLSPAVQRSNQATVFPGRSPEELRAPGISALYADVTGLPPALLTVGTADSVLDDSMFMAARLAAAGGRAELQIYPEGTHPFMTLPTAMAREARRRVVRFLRFSIDGND